MPTKKSAFVGVRKNDGVEITTNKKGTYVGVRKSNGVESLRTIKKIADVAILT